MQYASVESSKGKQIVLNTGWLCIFSNIHFFG